MLKLGSLAALMLIAAFLWFRFGADDQKHDLSAGIIERASSSNAGQVAAGKSNPARPAQARPTAGQPGSSSRRGGRPPSLVVAKPVTEALINDRLSAVGSGTAIASVSVVPLSGGILTEVLVDAGQRVAANDVLARLDDEEQTIARDRAARTAADAATDAERLGKLYRSRTTTEVELNLARAALADAELALREAEWTLSRRTITAPIDGISGFVSVDTGNYVTPQTELVTIDDRSTIVVEFWVPERFANQVKVGQPIEVTALWNPGQQHTGLISGVGSRIESDSRTLPVKASVPNDDDQLRPGMSFNVSMRFDGERFPAVDPLAVQWDSTGAFVWQVINDKVKRVPVRIVQRNPESVLIEGDLYPDDIVVTEGVLALRPGASVRMEGESRATASREQRGS